MASTLKVVNKQRFWGRFRYYYHRRCAIEPIPQSSVAKCQGFDGLIPVKMFASWGKRFRRTCIFAKLSLFEKIYASFSSFPCKNQPNVIKFLIFVLQNHIFSKLSLLKTPKLLQITHFSQGKIWFENFDPCKRIDILQLDQFSC